MIYLDVDVAITELPVNALPLIDDTDFKTRETAIAYNESGMDLVWHFLTPAGVYTQTAVTPTTAGVHDWAHKGEGKYTIEMPTSGGTVNNDTEGVGWWEGVCDGVLPWRSVDYCFRAAGLNGLLIEDAFSSTVGLAGSRLDATVSSRSSHSAPDLSNLDVAVSSRSSHAAPDLSNLDTTVSSRSSHSASDIWAVGTRTLTGFGTLVADIWHHLVSAITTSGSIGKLIKDNLDAAVSSRSSHAAPDVSNLDVAVSTRSSHGAPDLSNLDVAVSTRSSHGAPSVPTAAAVAGAVWDEAQADHTASGSMGGSLSNAGGGLTAAAIADAVWDEAAADHTSGGSMGEALGAAGGSSINRAIQGTATYNPNTKELRALVFLESAGTIQNATALVASLHQDDADATEVYGDGDFTKVENSENMWLISKADGSNITQVKNYFLKVTFTVGGTGYTRHLAIGAQF